MGVTGSELGARGKGKRPERGAFAGGEAGIGVYEGELVGAGNADLGPRLQDSFGRSADLEVVLQGRVQEPGERVVVEEIGEFDVGYGGGSCGLRAPELIRQGYGGALVIGSDGAGGQREERRMMMGRAV